MKEKILAIRDMLNDIPELEEPELDDPAEIAQFIKDAMRNDKLVTALLDAVNAVLSTYDENVYVVYDPMYEQPISVHASEKYAEARCGELDAQDKRTAYHHECVPLKLEE